MNKIHQLIHKCDNQDLGKLLVRLAIGIVFINAGWLKIQNIEFVVAFFSTLGFPAFCAYLVAYLEFIGGIAFVLGIFARYFGIALAITMLVAMFKVHWVNGYSIANNGYEYVFLLFLGSVAIVTLGSGRFSLARFFRKNSQ
ncbi:DoxX family protein [Candidatus Nomurabacteria bacterium]|nr:DoxX family protein [Candidatus Nomurabacteria bacterium]